MTPGTIGLSAAQQAEKAANEEKAAEAANQSSKLGGQIGLVICIAVASLMVGPLS